MMVLDFFLYVGLLNVISNSYLDCWLLTVDCWLLTVDCWLLTVDCWLLNVACWLLTVDTFLLTLDSWRLTLDSWLLTLDSWLLTLDSWLLTLDSWLFPQAWGGFTSQCFFYWQGGSNCLTRWFQLSNKVAPNVRQNLATGAIRTTLLGK